MRIPGILLWKLKLTRAEVDVVSAITTFLSWFVFAFPRGSPPASAPVLVTVAISDDPGSGSLSSTVLLVIWGSLAMVRSTVCWASPAGLEATQVKAPGAENNQPVILRDVCCDVQIMIMWGKRCGFEIRVVFLVVIMSCCVWACVVATGPLFFLWAFKPLSPYCF